MLGFRKRVSSCAKGQRAFAYAQAYAAIGQPFESHPLERSGDRHVG